MRSISAKYFWVLFPLLFLIAMIFQYVMDEKIISFLSIYIVVAILGFYLLIFNKNLFISVCIFFIPISFTVTLPGGYSLSAPSELMTLLLLVVAVVMVLSKPFFDRKIIFHPITILLMIDLGWMIVASLWSEYPIVSFKRVMARTSFLVVFYLLMAQWMQKKENLMKYLLLYSFGLLVPILFTAVKHAQYGFDPKTVYELCAPFFNEHTVFGACIAFVIPIVLIAAVNAKQFGLSVRLKRFLWFLFSILVIAEFLTFSRAAWLSLGAAFLMFVFLKLKLKFSHFLLILASTILLVVLFIDPLYQKAKENENLSNKGEIGEHLLSVGNLKSDASNLERVNRWFCAYKMFQDRPLTGFGPGTYQFVYGPYQSVYEMTYISTMAGDKGNAHSEPLTYLSETGLPGFLSYILWMLVTIRIAITAYYRSNDKYVKNMVLAALLGFTTFFMHGLVNSFIDQIKFSSLVFGSIAMIVAADIASRKNTAKNEA
jgi:putative inorganic carbon (HCO3(-)) transporter